MTKAEPIITAIHPVLQKIMERGIPVWKAEFHTAVNNSDDVPEVYFSLKSDNKNRKVEMFWINGDGLLCCHKGKHFMVPSSNVRYCKFE